MSGHLAAPSEMVFANVAFNLLDAMVAYWDKDKICRYANSAYLLWFGKTHEQMIGLPIQKLLGPLYEKNLPYIEEALKGRLQVFERAIPRPDGVTRHSLATYIPHVVGGEVRGFVAHVADVTKLKEYEAVIDAQRGALLAVNKKLQDEAAAHVTARMRLTEALTLKEAIYSSAPIALLTYDAAGRCTSANFQACQLTGATQEALLGQNFHELESWRISGLYTAALRALESGKPVSIEIFLHSTFGREVWVRCVFTPFPSNGEQCLLLMGEDITDRKRAELERERLVLDLTSALENVRTLEGILPICASCKKIRDDQGQWSHVEAYVSEHSKAEFSHGICPDCMERLYPEYSKD